MDIRYFLPIFGLFFSTLIYGGLDKEVASEVLIPVKTIIEAADILKLAGSIYDKLEDRKIKHNSSTVRTKFDAANFNLSLESNDLKVLHDQLTWFNNYLSAEERYLDKYLLHIDSAKKQLALSGMLTLSGITISSFGAILIRLGCYNEHCENNSDMVYTTSGALCFEKGIALQCANYLSYIIRIPQLSYREDCAANIPKNLIGRPIHYEEPISHWIESCSIMNSTIFFIPSALFMVGGALAVGSSVCSIAQAKWAETTLAECANSNEVKDCSYIIKKLDDMPEKLKKVLNNTNYFYLLNTGELNNCDFSQDEIYCQAQEYQAKSWWRIVKEVFTYSK